MSFSDNPGKSPPLLIYKELIAWCWVFHRDKEKEQTGHDHTMTPLTPSFHCAVNSWFLQIMSHALYRKKMCLIVFPSWVSAFDDFSPFCCLASDSEVS